MLNINERQRALFEFSLRLPHATAEAARLRTAHTNVLITLRTKMPLPVACQYPPSALYTNMSSIDDGISLLRSMVQDLLLQVVLRLGGWVCHKAKSAT